MADGVMSDLETILIVVGVAVVLLAAASAWVESRAERREEPAHRKVLKRNPRYREHIARRH